MKKKSKQKIIITGVVFVLLAFVPTFLKLFERQMQGDYGNPLINFKSQPLYPFITLIGIVLVFILLPIAVYKGFLRKKK